MMESYLPTLLDAHIFSRQTPAVPNQEARVIYWIWAGKEKNAHIKIG